MDPQELEVAKTLSGSMTAEEAPTAVISLMDALQKSVAAAKKTAADRPQRLVAPGATAQAKGHRKRKTS